jgi:hypothetical protein
MQTSRGNYLSSLSMRAEQVDFDGPNSWERNMDDLILKAAIWQDEHWVDWSALLKVEQSSERQKGAAKVVLLSFDRNREHPASLVIIGALQCAVGQQLNLPIADGYLSPLRWLLTLFIYHLVTPGLWSIFYFLLTTRDTPRL